METVRQLTARKEKSKEMLQVFKNKENDLKETESEKCENLPKLLLDMSAGIESVFRELSEIHNTRKIDDGYLTKELGEYNRKLSELAAKLLMKGVSLELMDGDGLFVPTEWLEGVPISLEKTFPGNLQFEGTPKNLNFGSLGGPEHW